MDSKMRRRAFLAAGTATALGVVGSVTRRQADTASTASTEPLSTTAPSPPFPMPERMLGGTGVRVPILGLGGAGQTPLSQRGEEKKAMALIRRALELGIRYFDTAASYGPSEDYLGKVLPAYRQDIFLASKTAARDRDGAWRELERSLRRLNTDYLDLWQFHHVSFNRELETIFGADGAIQALEEAQQQNLVRFSGITGHHDPNIIAEGLRRYPFDAALIPINAADVHHPQPFIPAVLPLAQERQVGVIAMKVPAYGRLFKPGVLDGMHQAMGYTLSQPGVHCCVIAAEDGAQLEANVQVASAFHPLDPSSLAEIEQRTAAAWRDNTFFRAWT